MLRPLATKSHASLLGLAAAALIALPALSRSAAFDSSCNLADVLGPYWNAEVEVTNFGRQLFVLNADVRWGPIYIGTGGAANWNSSQSPVSFELAGFDHYFALNFPSGVNNWGDVVNGPPCGSSLYYFVLPNA